MPEEIRRHILHLPKGKSRLTQFKPRLAIAKTDSAKRLSNSYREQRFSGRALQTRNARILRRDPACKHCLAKIPEIVSESVEVDHIIPVHLGGSDSDDNLQGLCVECHKVKTSKEAAARANGTAVMVGSRPPKYTIA